MGKPCLQSRPRGPAPKISPARKGWVHNYVPGCTSQAVERRRRGTTFFVCSLGAEESWACGPPKLIKISCEGDGLQAVHK
jgi:hypothetical protein